MNKNSKIYVAGHLGLVGSAIETNLTKKGFTNILKCSRQELDLLNQKKVAKFFSSEKPEYVFLAAAKVGGIVANNLYRGEFIYENLQVQNNIIHQSYIHGVKKLLFLGSTCIYPKECEQPMREEFLLTSPLEFTNEPYAVAKIAGIKMCESYNLQYGTNFISVMPTNLYGPNDNYNLETSHVLPALIRKLHLGKLYREKNYKELLFDLQLSSLEEARSYLLRHGVTAEKVEIWGSGKPMREFLWSEDMADACVFIMENINFLDLIDKGSMDAGKSSKCSTISDVRNTHINIGTGIDISIYDLSYMIKDIVGFEGDIYFNKEKPDGTYKKLTDVSKLHSLGWKHTVGLSCGISMAYRNYLDKINDTRRRI